MAPQPYYKQNRLKQLRAFCHTARNGSITKAAPVSYTHLTLPTIYSV